MQFWLYFFAIWLILSTKKYIVCDNLGVNKKTCHRNNGVRTLQVGYVHYKRSNFCQQQSKYLKEISTGIIIWKGYLCLYVNTLNLNIRQCIHADNRGGTYTTQIFGIQARHIQNHVWAIFQKLNLLKWLVICEKDPSCWKYTLNSALFHLDISIQFQ